jgi:hypothetical protein
LLGHVGGMGIENAMETKRSKPACNQSFIPAFLSVYIAMGWL